MYDHIQQTTRNGQNYYYHYHLIRFNVFFTFEWEGFLRKTYKLICYENEMGNNMENSSSNFSMHFKYWFFNLSY